MTFVFRFDWYGQANSHWRFQAVYCVTEFSLVILRCDHFFIQILFVHPLNIGRHLGFACIAGPECILSREQLELTLSHFHKPPTKPYVKETTAHKIRFEIPPPNPRVRSHFVYWKCIPVCYLFSGGILYYFDTRSFAYIGALRCHLALDSSALELHQDMSTVDWLAM